ncbi:MULTISPECIES: hypothetical protein [Rhizobium/Agrobacterium group]|uniref:hypothetical protein n=1 Tax=Rhizobium/Agrobacterium group TaxID=227290 RepID=UPI001877EC65|nr:MULTISPECIES: hypothetical protein [Rhizobium/Agrobacterium group]
MYATLNGCQIVHDTAARVQTEAFNDTDFVKSVTHTALIPPVKHISILRISVKSGAEFLFSAAEPGQPVGLPKRDGSPKMGSTASSSAAWSQRFRLAS